VRYNTLQIRGLQYLKLNGNQMGNVRISKKNKPSVFLKMLEKPVFAHLHSKLAKNLHYCSNFFIIKKINMCIKIAEFCDDFYFVDAGLTTCSYKRCTGRFFGTGNNFFSEHFFKTPVNKL
jgi:hypothetical protein